MVQSNTYSLLVRTTYLHVLAVRKAPASNGGKGSKWLGRNVPWRRGCVPLLMV